MNESAQLMLEHFEPLLIIAFYHNPVLHLVQSVTGQAKLLPYCNI